MTRALTLEENAAALALDDFVRKPTLEESVDFLESITNELERIVESAIASRRNLDALEYAEQFYAQATLGLFGGVPVQVGPDATLWTEGLEPDELRDLQNELREITAQWESAVNNTTARLRPAWRAVVFTQTWVIPGYRRTIARRSPNTQAFAVAIAQALLQYFGAAEKRAAVS